jgi:hypothetical protein
MPTLGYQQLYANGLNNFTQLRRSTDMVYQRGANYNIVVTGDTYLTSLQLDVDLYSNDVKVGRMSLIPYDVQSIDGDFNYYFNLRPYDYLSNYIKSQHMTYYLSEDFEATNDLVNINNPYPNIIKANFKYGWTYVSGTTSVSEFTGSPTNNLVHYSNIPNCVTGTTFIPSGFTNTGEYFNYVGGQFQIDEAHYFLPNYDQEIGTNMVASGLTVSSNDLYRRLNPISPYIMDYPTVPEQSETGKFLTDAPRIQYIQSNENYVLYYLNGQTGDRQVIETDYYKIDLYNSSNVRVTGYTQQINLSGTTYASPTGYTDTLKVFALPVGPSDINNVINATQTWDDIAYYTVQLCYAYPTNSASRVSVGAVGPASEMFYFYLYNNCLAQNTRICWLNAKGGYDYFTFRSYRQDTKKIKAQTYDNRYYSNSSTGPDFSFGRSTKTYATDVDQEVVLESGYLTKPVGDWLQQLFYSPQVYEVKSNYVSPLDSADKIYWDLSPLQTLSTEVDTINKKHQKLNKYRITFKSSNTFFTNRGF